MAKRGRIRVKAREVIFLLLFQIRPFPINEELFLPHQVIDFVKVVLCFIRVETIPPTPCLGSATCMLSTQDSKDTTRRGGRKQWLAGKGTAPGGVNLRPPQQAAEA